MVLKTNHSFYRTLSPISLTYHQMICGININLRSSAKRVSSTILLSLRYLRLWGCGQRLLWRTPRLVRLLRCLLRCREWKREISGLVSTTFGEKSTTSTSSLENRNTRSRTASRSTGAAGEWWCKISTVKLMFSETPASSCVVFNILGLRSFVDDGWYSGHPV